VGIDFFFYGTLVDAEIRRLVLGREVPDAAMRAALLPEHRRYSVQGQPYPATVPEAGATTDGVIMSGASLQDAAILSCFEGQDYDAVARRVTIPKIGAASVDELLEPTAWVFIASERVARDRGEWSIDDWRAEHKPAFLAIANRWLDGINADDIKKEERRWRQRLGALSNQPGANGS